MKYTTTNEWNHFGFSEAYISEIQKINGYLQFTLDNVLIHPENSKNRDIRQMRTNGLYFKIQDAKVLSVTEEGYKEYDADGKLRKQYEDQEIPQERHFDILKFFSDGECCIYSLEKVEDTYVFTIDADNERTYELRIAGTWDMEEWERFLNV